MKGGVTRHPGLRSALPALALAAALALAPAAFAAGDPVRSGSFDLKLSGAFKSQLSRHRVAMAPRSFAIKSGSVDPITGSGSFALNGRMTFKHGKTKVVYKHLTVTLGQGGALKGGRTTLFGLSGGSVKRNGFGAIVSGVDATFPSSAAASLGRKLKLSSLRAVNAGLLSVSELPQTVEVLSGTATVTPDMSAGSVASKLAAHCVDPSTGISVIAPGTQPGGPGTTFSFPVVFGNIDPGGIGGTIQESGGIQLANGGAGLPAGCPASNTFTIRLSDLSADLGTQQVSAQVSLSGPGSPFGDIDTVVSFPIDINDAWENADPFNLAVATNGSVIRLNAAAAQLMNYVLPQPSPSDPSMQFADGDSFGTAGLSVQVR